MIVVVINHLLLEGGTEYLLIGDSATSGLPYNLEYELSAIFSAKPSYLKPHVSSLKF